MTLTRIVTVLMFAVLAADYSHGCDTPRLLQCSQQYLDVFRSANMTMDIICRSDVLSNMKCVLEEGQACGILDKYISSVRYSSWSDVEKACASAGYPVSQNAAKQTLPSAMIIMGLLTALLVRTFSL